MQQKSIVGAMQRGKLARTKAGISRLRIGNRSQLCDLGYVDEATPIFVVIAGHLTMVQLRTTDGPKGETLDP